jgi:hypothetical protein
MDGAEIIKLVGIILGAGIVLSLLVTVVISKNKNVVKQKSKGANSPNSSVIDNGATNGGQRQSKD